MISHGEKHEEEEQVLFHHRLALMAQGYALVAHTPVEIFPSEKASWRYIVHIHADMDRIHDQECGIEDLFHVVTDALELSGWRARLEQGYVDRIIDEYLSKQGSMGETAKQTDQLV